MVCHNLRVNYPHGLLLVLAGGRMKKYVPTQEQRRLNKVMKFSKVQNQRITEQLSLEVVLWRSSGPNPLLKQGHLQQVAQDLVHMGMQREESTKQETRLT